MVLDLKAWRWVCAIAAILAFGWAVPALAQTGPCAAARGIVVEDARLVYVPDRNAAAAWVRLSGRAEIPPELETWNWGPALCVATAGSGLQINGRPYCNLFEHRSLSGDDRIERSGNQLRFSLMTRVERGSNHFSVVLDPGQGVCAGRLTLEVRPGPGRRFGSVGGTPRLLTSDRAEFEIQGGARENPLGIFVDFDFAQGQGQPPPSRQAFVGPTSWQDQLQGPLAGFGGLLPVFCLAVGVLFLFAILNRRVPIPDWQPTLWARAENPIVVALALLLAGALLDAADSGANPIVSWLVLQPDQGGGAIALLRGFGGGRLLGLTIETLLLAGFAVAALLLHLLLLPLTRTGRGPLAAIPRIILCAGTIAFAMSLPAALLGAVEPVPWLGYEGPALLISFGYALLGAGVLAALYEYSGTTIFWISLLVALTVLFPTDPVIRGESEVEISRHSVEWARFLASPAAGLIYIAALAGLALRIGQDAAADAAAAGKWLAFLLLLQIAGLSMITPTRILAVAGVLLLSVPWLFPLQAPARNPRGKAKAAEDGYDPAFPWLVGGAAATIFFLQYVFRAGDEDGVHRFAMLSMSGVPRTFAVGLTAGLLLARAMPLLRGDSATLKAAHLGLLIILVNMASALDILSGRERLVAMLTEHMAVIGALILCAVVRFDLPRVRSPDGGFKWRDMFKGTTLAQAVPLVTTVAVALFTALAPIIVNEIGEAFGTFLNGSLPPVPATH